MLNATHDRNGSPLILGAVCLAALTLPLSFSAGAVATPAIGRDLGGTAEELTWITNAFMLTFGSLLMAAGTLADRYGRKRIFTIGVATFTLFSIALGLAPSVWLIDLLRAGQGVGAAAALAGGSAALAQEFEGQARARAFSLLGATFGAGLAFGPVITGLLIETVGWRAIFLTSAFVGTAAQLLGPPRMRETRGPDAGRLDWLGAMSFTATLATFTVAMIASPSIGLQSAAMLALGFAFATFLVAFTVIELRAARPMLDLSLFRYRRFVGVRLLPIATCTCFVVLLVIMPLRFIGMMTQRDRGRVSDAGALRADARDPDHRSSPDTPHFSRRIVEHRLAGGGGWPPLVGCRGRWIRSFHHCANAPYRGRQRLALGSHGRFVSQRGAERTGRNGDRHLRNSARGGGRRGAGDRQRDARRPHRGKPPSRLRLV